MNQYIVRDTDGLYKPYLEDGVYTEGIEQNQIELDNTNTNTQEENEYISIVKEDTPKLYTSSMNNMSNIIILLALLILFSKVKGASR